MSIEPRTKVDSELLRSSIVLVEVIIKKKQDHDKEAERKKLYALADPETEPAADASANFQAITKPKLFADEQFK